MAMDARRCLLGQMEEAGSRFGERNQLGAPGIGTSDRTNLQSHSQATEWPPVHTS